MGYLHFIVNPISGNGKHLISLAIIRKYFGQEAFRIQIDYTQHRGHSAHLG